MRITWILVLLVMVLSSCDKDTGLSVAEQTAADIVTIDTYLEENSVQNVMTDPSGLRYVIIEEGTGDRPKTGDRVEVDYTGWFLDGEMFDTSIEANANAGNIYNPSRTYAPIDFVLGVGQVIPGWDIGIGLLDEKAKATFYIPSTLAYGSAGQGSIPPNAILVFDVELISISE